MCPNPGFVLGHGFLHKAEEITSTKKCVIVNWGYSEGQVDVIKCSLRAFKHKKEDNGLARTCSYKIKRSKVPECRGERQCNLET